MITSYEVGAVLRVIDEASPVLTKMAGVLKGVSEQIIAINKSLGGIAEASGIATKSVVENFALVDRSLLSSVDAARALKVEIGEIAAASRGVGAPRISASVAAAAPGGGAPPGIRARSSYGAGGGHISGPSVPIPGGSHVASGGIFAAIAGILGLGAVDQAELQDAEFQLLYHSGLANTDENKKKFGDIIQNFMSKSGASLHDISEAAKQEIRMFKGTPGGGVDVLPEMLQAAWVESKLKGTSLEESMTSLIGLSHMTTEYGPEAIKKLAPTFAFLSASNPSSLTSMERAAGYAVPFLNSGLEIDPMQTLMLGTVLTRAGITNTKSGTWLRNMAVNAMPGTSLMSDKAYEKHEGALYKLGLVDEKGNPTWFTGGKPDLMKMMDIASAHAASIPLTERGAYEKQLFGAQGSGAFAVLANPAVREQVGNLNAEMNGDAFKNRYSTFMQDYAANSPIQQWRETWGDLQNVLMDVGKGVLPVLNPAIKLFDDHLKATLLVFDELGKAVDWVKGKLPSLNPMQGGNDNHGDGPSLAPLLPIQKNSFSPSGANGGTESPAHITTAVYLDGRIIGETVSSELARISTFPRQAAYGDPYSGYVAPDYNTSSI